MKRSVARLPLIVFAGALGGLFGCERPAPPDRTAGGSGPTPPAAGSPSAARPDAGSVPPNTAQPVSPAASAGKPEAAASTNAPRPGADAANPAAKPSVSSDRPAIPPPPANVPNLKYEVPADWKAEAVQSQFRKAQYLLPRAADDKDDSRMVVSYFGPGQGGPVAANVERWFNQFSNADGGPADLTKARTETLTVNNLPITVVEITGYYTEMALGGSAPKRSDTEQQLLAAIIETPNGAWFLKCVGPTASIKAQREVFLKMLQTVQP